LTPGRIQASILQAADMFHPQLPEFEGKPITTLVPVGADQDPHLRIARDMKSKFREHNFEQLASTYNVFLPALKGGSKMSSSDPMSYIAMTDSPADVKKKINKYAFSGGRETIEEHRKKGGNPDIDVSFQYLKMFFEPDDEKLAQIETDYRSGKLLTGELKSILIDKVNVFLKDHQAKRKLAESQVDKFLKN
jgi:tryptophanyl-tRNA synthetase